MPHDLESLTIARGSDFAPRYLGSADERWVASLLDELRGLDGVSIEEVDGAWASRIAPQLLSLGVERHAMERVWRLARRHTKTSVDAIVKPALLRQRVFERAAQSSSSRDEVLNELAREHDVSTGDIVRSLFADRIGARRLSLHSRLPSPRQLVRGHNTSVLMSVLARASAVRVLVREDLASVACAAKVRGLVAMFSASDEGTVVELSGPLALFHHTTKYANALAALVPVVARTRGFRLVARCETEAGETRLVRASHADELAAAEEAPRAVESPTSRAIRRALAKLDSPWRFEARPPAFRWERGALFPDFVFRRGSREVLVEVAGYTNEAYLRRKVRELSDAALTNVLVCVDRELASGGDSVISPAILRFSGKIEVLRLLAAVEALSLRDARQASRAGQ